MNLRPLDDCTIVHRLEEGEQQPLFMKEDEILAVVARSGAVPETK